MPDIATREPRNLSRAAVAYLDVLGTRVVPAGPTGLDYARRLVGLRSFAQEEIRGPVGLVRMFYAVVAGARGLVEESVDHFSDSMFFSIPLDEGREIYALSELADTLVRVFHYGLANRLPLRGAVSVGPCVVGDGIYIGGAAAEAVEWERFAQWSGVIFTPSATRVIMDEEERDPASVHLQSFAWYNVPTQGSPIATSMDHLTLAWPRYGPEDLRTRVDRMYLGDPLPIEAAAKYLNTLEFVDEIGAEPADRPKPGTAARLRVELIWRGVTDTGASPIPSAGPGP